MTDYKALREIVKAAHGAGYHNALNGVDPFESEKQAVDAALQSAKEPPNGK